MKSIDGILKLVDNEFSVVVQNGRFRSREEIDSVYKMMDIVKDAHCIWAYEEEEEAGYSEEGGSYESGAYRSNRSNRSNRGSYDDSYESGMSGARGRGRGARRDSMGRYSREDGMSGRSERSERSYRRGGYSRDDAKQEFVDELREMMDNAPDDKSRQEIQKMIQQMEQN